MQYINPFPVNQYLGPQYFCDREKETEQLITTLTNGNSTTLIAQRRIGKTALIHHVFHKLPKGWKGIYIDILETEDLDQFLNLFATAVLQAIPQKSKAGNRLWNFFKTLRPVFSFDPLSGQPQVLFDVKASDTQKNIESILQMLDTLESKFIIALDEFQQINQYPEHKTDAWLRARMQQLKNIFFIFSGSQQHLMSELFSSPDRPFFRSTQILKLGKLPREVYADFIRKKFQQSNKTIDNLIVEEMLEWTNGHTFYVQQLCNRVFSQTTDMVTSDLWRHAASDLLTEQETFFFTLRNLVTRQQWNLLKAIALEGRVFQPSASQFINLYNLGTSATVLRSLKALLGYELILHDYDETGQPYYAVYDVYLQRWVEQTIR